MGVDERSVSPRLQCCLLHNAITASWFSERHQLMWLAQGKNGEKSRIRTQDSMGSERYITSEWQSGPDESLGQCKSMGWRHTMCFWSDGKHGVDFHKKFNRRPKLMFINIFINAKVPIRPGHARGGINQTFLYVWGRECVNPSVLKLFHVKDPPN